MSSGTQNSRNLFDSPIADASSGPEHTGSPAKAPQLKRTLTAGNATLKLLTRATLEKGPEDKGPVRISKLSKKRLTAVKLHKLWLENISRHGPAITGVSTDTSWSISRRVPGKWTYECTLDAPDLESLAELLMKPELIATRLATPTVGPGSTDTLDKEQ
jgi:hypothetical protein